MDAMIVDYGMGNLKSVQRAFEFHNAVVNLTSQPSEIMAAKRLIIPGVGAFPDAMDELDRLGLTNPIKLFAEAGKPLLGICLGMQLLFDSSTENGFREGLGIIEGSITKIPTHDNAFERIKRKVPHVGWNSLEVEEANQHHCLRQITNENYFYFVHSYAAKPTSNKTFVVNATYNGLSLPAFIAQDNTIGCQFHPEKSGYMGLSILKAFLELG